jgi:hypothetical protein
MWSKGLTYWVSALLRITVRCLFGSSICATNLRLLPSS